MPKRKSTNIDVGDLFEKLHPARTLSKRDRIKWNKWHERLYLAADKMRDRAVWKQAPTHEEVNALLDLIAQIPYVEV